MTMTRYSVHIDATGPPYDDVSGPDVMESMYDALESIDGIDGVITSWGGVAGGPGTAFGVQAPNPATAAKRGANAFEQVMSDLRIHPISIARLEVMTEGFLEAEVNTPNYPDLVGIGEIAEMLGVSKQRASELARSRTFPPPFHELSCGPIWLKAAVHGFATRWERKPGRPRKEAAG